MNAAIQAYYRWHNGYHIWGDTHKPKGEAREQLFLQYQAFLAELPGVLWPLVDEAERHGIDSTPIINMAASFNPRLTSDAQFDTGMDAVFTIVKRIEAKQTLATAPVAVLSDEDRGKRFDELICLKGRLKSAGRDIESLKTRLNRLLERDERDDPHRQSVESWHAYCDLAEYEALLHQKLSDAAAWATESNITAAACKALAGMFSNPEHGDIQTCLLISTQAEIGLLIGRLRREDAMPAETEQPAPIEQDPPPVNLTGDDSLQETAKRGETAWTKAFRLHCEATKGTHADKAEAWKKKHPHETKTLIQLSRASKRYPYAKPSKPA